MIGIRGVAALAAAATGLVAAGVANAATAVSSNWSGYAVTGATYSSVTGTWTEPTAACSTTTTSVTASAFWVGLGGDSSNSDALEQAGTEADCGAAGTARYSASYELVPAASVKLPLVISAGDRVSATVNVQNTTVTVKVDDLTTGKSATKTMTMASPDVSSAEWIAEAPSVVTNMGTELLPLTDFGSVSFSDAHATTSSSATGTISDGAWTATRIDLDSSSGGPDGPGRSAGPGSQFGTQITAAQATPTRLTTGGSSFRVTWMKTATTQTDAPVNSGGKGSTGAGVTCVLAQREGALRHTRPPFRRHDPAARPEPADPLHDPVYAQRRP